MKINLVYFSATGTTKRIMSAIAEGMGVEDVNLYNITWDAPQHVSVLPDEVTLFAVPVYSGRIPQTVVENINCFSGNGGAAIIVCVYGNRDFDDALLELRDLVVKNNFYVISASAFVAQHSIFPQVGQGRPDAGDLDKAREFGAKSLEVLNGAAHRNELSVKGNCPYREIASIPLKPKTRRTCNSCGLCVKQCPVQAIDANDSRKIDKHKCLSCAHCIAICPKHAKHFGGLLYWLVSKKFTKKYSQRQEPYVVFE